MNPESPAAALDRLEGEGATGCLEVDGDVRVCLVLGGLVLLGIVFYLAVNSRG